MNLYDPYQRNTAKLSKSDAIKEHIESELQAVGIKRPRGIKSAATTHILKINLEEIAGKVVFPSKNTNVQVISKAHSEK